MEWAPEVGPLGRGCVGFGAGMWQPTLTWPVFHCSDLPCYMTVEEMKSLIRLPDIIACAKQNVTVAEISAWQGTGLTGVLRWLQDTHSTSS